MGFHIFSESISSKANVIAGLEIELAYYKVAAQHVSHDTLEICPLKHYYHFFFFYISFYFLFILFIAMLRSENKNVGIWLNW